MADRNNAGDKPADKPSGGGDDKSKALDGKKPATGAAAGKKPEKKEEELSEEDQRKKAEMDLQAERLRDADPGVVKLALQLIREEIRSATASMTSIPKPIKFLRPHYAALKETFDKVADGENRRAFADILAVLALNAGAEAEAGRESLRFKLQGNIADIDPWGHEFVRNLAGEISAEFGEREGADKDTADLLALVGVLVPFNIKHNAEHEACDLLLEVGKLPQILDYVDDTNYSRVCLYLISMASYVPEPESSDILKIALSAYRKVSQLAYAMRLAIKLGDMELVKELFQSAEGLDKKQLAFLLARQNLFMVLDDQVNDLIGNTSLNEHFQALARDLDVVEAKTPEDIYKMHLVETRGAGQASADSAKQNLAATFVNAFVNAGFGSDKLLTTEGINWVQLKNKAHGMMSAAASEGMVLMWDIDGGFSRLDKYSHSSQDMVRAGGLLGVGILNSGVRNEFDPAMAVLVEHLGSTVPEMRIGAVLGFGLAYAGSQREDIRDLLLPVVEDPTANMEVAGMAALALGMIFVGSCDADIVSAIVQQFYERDEPSLNNTHARFMALALGLLFLSKQDRAEVTLQTLKALPKSTIASYSILTLETCAYCGTGAVLKIQEMLSICGEHPPKPEKSAADDKKGAAATTGAGAGAGAAASGAATASTAAAAAAGGKDAGGKDGKDAAKEAASPGSPHQAVATLGIALIAMGEELGAEMALRAFDHLLQYAEPVVRRAVPLALGLICISNPAMGVTDTLSKLSHDADDEVSMCAIFGLGMVGAGTNNARIGGLLRNLSAYHGPRPNHLFMVRIAQGLLHLGKGTLSLSPFHSDRLIMNQVAMCGLLAVVHSCFDIKNTILAKTHYILFALSVAMFPRMLMTLDENLKPLPVPVRVGQAVDTVGQAGRPKTITGFQTHTTPVILSYGDRAELATDEYIALSPILEGFVILKPNPNAAPKS